MGREEKKYMNLFTILKCILIAIMICFFHCLFIHYYIRFMKYLIDKDYIFLSRFLAVVLITAFSVVYCFSVDMFVDYMSRVLP